MLGLAVGAAVGVGEDGTRRSSSIAATMNVLGIRWERVVIRFELTGELDERGEHDIGVGNDGHVVMLRYAHVQQLSCFAIENGGLKLEKDHGGMGKVSEEFVHDCFGAESQAFKPMKENIGFVVDVHAMVL